MIISVEVDITIQIVVLLLPSYECISSLINSLH